MGTQREWFCVKKSGLAGPTPLGISLPLPVPALGLLLIVSLLHWFNCNSSFAATSR